MKAIKRNWEDLPTELLHLIVRELPDYCDFIRLRAVCKSWRASLSVSYLPPQFPWILKLGKGNKPHLKFYCIASQKVYTIHAAESSNKEHVSLAINLIRQFGSGDQFSLLRYRQYGQFPERYLSILNTLISREVGLPFLDDSESTNSHLGPEPLPSMYHAHFSPGDLGYRCAYSKGLFFMIEHNTQNKVTKVLDIGSHKEVCVIPSPEGESHVRAGPYLVESSGEILRVNYTVSYKRANYKFTIHRLELTNGNGQPCWVKITSIGDQILFFDFIAGRAFSLRATDFSGFKGNHIYFIRRVRRVFGQGPPVNVVNKYYIRTGKTEFVRPPFNREKSITWFVPFLNPYLKSMHH
ncbi:F-box protein [Rhynchospora pubera]|uniref:F-box protein n=1 Tax=Rhynchospora pubera TaxID=906938 RepID=A0AAV8HFY4_9POAL|nr:F-box protein [Rhynchospora pubera]